MGYGRIPYFYFLLLTSLAADGSPPTPVPGTPSTNLAPVLDEVVLISPLQQVWTRWECRVNKWADDGDRTKVKFLYMWMRNGEPISSFKSSYNIFPITDDLGSMRGDLISCKAKIQDEEGLFSPEVAAEGLVIVNSPPEILQVLASIFLSVSCCCYGCFL